MKTAEIIGYSVVFAFFWIILDSWENAIRATVLLWFGMKIRDWGAEVLERLARLEGKNERDNQN